MAGEEVIAWTHDMEVRLFLAMRWNQPVGVNRHFHMLFLQERLSRAVGKWIGYEQIWNHLRTLYDVKALEEIEDTRYEDEASDFTLPKEYFDENTTQTDMSANTSSGSVASSGAMKGKKEEGSNSKLTDGKRDKTV